MQKTNTIKADAIHLLLNQEAIQTVARYEDDIYCTYEDTYNELKQGRREIYTTIPHFLNFKYAKKLFVHTGRIIHEITLGKGHGTAREIKKTHNIEKLLLSDEFDWWKKNSITK